MFLWFFLHRFQFSTPPISDDLNWWYSCRLPKLTSLLSLGNWRRKSRRKSGESRCKAKKREEREALAKKAAAQVATPQEMEENLTRKKIDVAKNYVLISYRRRRKMKRTKSWRKLLLQTRTWWISWGHGNLILEGNFFFSSLLWDYCYCSSLRYNDFQTSFFTLALRYFTALMLFNFEPWLAFLFFSWWW